MNNKEKLKKRICKKCGGKLRLRKTKSINTMWLFKLVCKCGYCCMGKGVPNNIINPFYFSIKSKNKISKRLKVLGFKSYRDYLVSKIWQKNKKLVGKKCLVCGKKGDIHHRTYSRLGKELKRDLIPLCREHHYYTHFIYNN